MFSRDTQPLEHDRSRESQTHAHFLLLALSRAAQAIQRAHTAEDFYTVVGKEIQSLGGNVALLLLNEDRQSLSIAYLSYPPELIRKGEQMTGLSMRTYRLPIIPGGIYERTLQGRTAVYTVSSIDTLKESLPKPIQALCSPLATIFNLRQGVLAPLWVGDEALGLLKVDGAFLSHDDLSAMDSFAGQIAAGLYNVRLMQNLKDELAARTQAEEALTHNRNLLLALGRAANQIQLVHEPDEIFRTVGEHIRALGFEITILKFGSEKKSLHYQYTSVPEKIIHTAEKMVGFEAKDFYWQISEESIYGRVIKERRSEYIEDGKTLFKEALPKYLHPFAGKLIELLSTDNGIIAPLYVDDETLGIMLVYGAKRLGQEDVHAVDFFAAQISVCLRNTLLAKQVAQELQERKHVEEALLASKTTFEGIFNNVTETIYIQDENGVFLDVNEGAERMYGYPREYFIGRTPEFLSAPGRNDLVKVAGYVQQAFLGQSAEFEFWGIKKDGTIFPKDVRLTPGMYFGKNVVIAVARDITERKKIEEAVRLAEKRFRALIENAPDGIVLAGEDGKIKYASPSAREMFDYKDEDYTKYDPLNYIHPDDISVVLEGITRIIEDPSYTPTFQYRYKHNNGSYRWVDSTFSNQMAEPGVEAVVINFRDITERKEMETALHESEKYYRALIENAPDGIMVVNQEAKISFESPSVARLLGYKPGELLGKNAFELINPDDLAQIMEIFMNGLDLPGLVHRGEYRLLHSDGDWRYFEIVSHYLMNEPAIMGIIINGRDITERKQIEEAVHRTERRFRALIENAMDGILIVSSERKVEYESPSVPRLLGYGAETLMRPDTLGLIHPDDVDELYEAFRIGLETPGYVHRGEYRLKDVHGEWRYIEIVSQFLMKDSAVEGVIINGRDITERKSAESALRESERRFHSIVSESNDGITLTDETGHILEFNNALEELTGLKRDEVLGMYIWDLMMRLIPQNEITDEMHRRVKEDIQHYLDAGEDPKFSAGIEVSIERTDRTRRFIQVRVFSIRTDKGWRLGSIVRDITEKKQAEEALRQQFNNLRTLYQMTAILGQSSDLEEVFHTALNSLQSTLATDRAAVLLFDPDGVIRFKSWQGLSDAYRKAVEGHSPWKPDDPEPQPILVPDVERDPGVSHLLSALVNEGIGSLGFIPILYQGKLLGKFMIYFNKKHQYHDGEVQLAQTIARHVAFAISRQKADDALRASEKMYRILYEDNPSMYFTADENGLTLSVNKYGVNQLGFAPDELIGKPIVDIFHPDDRESVRLQIELCMSSPEQTVQIEARKIDKNGVVRWVRESACAVRDTHGHLVVLVTCDDVTKRKQAEDELRHANRSLQAAHKDLQKMFEYEQTLARTDALTGLFNRRHFFDIAIREFNAALRYRRQMTIIMFDVDGFKKANDTFGHSLGDDILTRISQVTKSQVREVDILARYGGDEFTVLLPETNADQAYITAERIRQSAEFTGIEAGSSFLSVTLSIGIAEIDLASDRSVEDIIRRADQALYTAKQAGRNHTVVYSAGKPSPAD